MSPLQTMADFDYPPRPATPQVMVHRLPDKPLDESAKDAKYIKYIILIEASTHVSGKVQIAETVAQQLSCPLFLGDSTHDSSAKAALVGSAKPSSLSEVTSGPNQDRYQRMWLSKMTRTGLLFPDESRPATEGFSGFGGSTSSSSSREGSLHTTSRPTSQQGSLSPTEGLHPRSPITNALPPATSGKGLNKVFTISEKDRLRRDNPALMVLTHPELDPWHRKRIILAVGDYDIGVIFVPLHNAYRNSDDFESEDELPILQPLNPSAMTRFPISSIDHGKVAQRSDSEYNQVVVHIDTDANVDRRVEQIVREVRTILKANS